MVGQVGAGRECVVRAGVRRGQRPGGRAADWQHQQHHIERHLQECPLTMTRTVHTKGYAQSTEREKRQIMLVQLERKELQCGSMRRRAAGDMERALLEENGVGKIRRWCGGGVPRVCKGRLVSVPSAGECPISEVWRGCPCQRAV